MRRLFFLYLFLAIAVTLGLYIGKDPGYVFLSFGHYTVETPLWVAITAIFLLFLVSYAILRLLAKLGGLRQGIRSISSRRRAKKANKKTHLGLIAFSEGRWQEAETMLNKGLPGNQLPLVNYLISARAAEAQGDLKARDNYLNEALKAMPEAKIAILLTQAQLQIASQQYEQADATLNYIGQLAPNHVYLLKMQALLYQRMQSYERVYPLLPKLKKQSFLSKEKYQDLEARTYQHLFSSLIKERQFVKLDELYKSVPKSLRYQESIVNDYCQGLLLQEKQEAADSLLKSAIKKSFSSKLVTLYAQIPCKKTSNKLSFLEGFTNQHADSSELLLALAKLSYQLKLWGKTRSYLEKCLKISRTPKAIYELGRLHEALNENDKAEKYFNQALNAVFNEPIDSTQQIED